MPPRKPHWSKPVLPPISATSPLRVRVTLTVEAYVTLPTTPSEIDSLEDEPAFPCEIEDLPPHLYFESADLEIQSFVVEAMEVES